MGVQTCGGRGGGEREGLRISEGGIRWISKGNGGGSGQTYRVQIGGAIENRLQINYQWGV